MFTHSHKEYSKNKKKKEKKPKTLDTSKYTAKVKVVKSIVVKREAFKQV